MTLAASQLAIITIASKPGFGTVLWSRMCRCRLAGVLESMLLLSRAFGRWTNRARCVEVKYE